MDMQVNAQLIRSEREKRAWSQSHLADVSGLGLRTVQRIEATGNASFESAAAVASAFSIDVSRLIAKDQPSAESPPGISPRKWLEASRPAAQLTIAAVMTAGLLLSVLWMVDEPFRADISAPGQAEFLQIESVDQLEAMLVAARGQNQPVMLDVTADWCVACTAMETETLRDTAVIAALEPFLLLRVDITEMTDDDRDLLSELDALGPPTMKFFDRAGNLSEHQPLVGFIPAVAFRGHLAEIAARK